MSKTLFRLLLIGSSLGFLASCALLQQAIKEPNIAFESFRLGNTTADSIELIPQVRITNLNDFPIPLDGINYKLKLNDRDIFDGAISKIGTLKPNKAKSVEIPVRLTNQTLDFFVNSLFQDKQINYAVDGKAKVKSFSLPFDHNGIVFLPEVKIGQMDFSELSLNNISANLPIEIVNKNDFEIPFKGLQYSVKNKGKQLFANNVTQNNISKGKTTQLNLPFEIDPKNLVTSSLQLLQNPTLDLDFNAIADFGFTKLPFNQTTPIKLRN